MTETLSLHEQGGVSEAVSFARENAGFFCGAGTGAVAALLYSALLSRGLANVRRDMDAPDLPLIGAHGYCSQELVNLLLTGRYAQDMPCLEYLKSSDIKWKKKMP